jgi:hypothetical protein
MAGADETVGMKSPPDPHYRHRFPAEIISHAVWLYHAFSLSLRQIADMRVHGTTGETPMRRRARLVSSCRYSTAGHHVQ